MTFILMEMEEEEKALDADLGSHIHLRRGDWLLLCHACSTAHSQAPACARTHTHAHTLSCSVLSPNWPPVKISLILRGLYFLLAELG